MTTKRKRLNKDVMAELEAISGEKLSFGGLIRAIRLGEEITQNEFAALLGISKQYLCDIECGRRFPSPKAAVAYAELLGYSAEQFVRLCLQDMFDKEGLKLVVDVQAA